MARAPGSWYEQTWPHESWKPTAGVLVEDESLDEDEEQLCQAIGDTDG